MNMSAITRKARADVMRRPGRTLLVILGIMVGILGLTAINVASDAVNTVFANGNDRSTSPDIHFSVVSVDPKLSSTLAQMPNVQTVEINTHYQTRWHVATPSGTVCTSKQYLAISLTNIVTAHTLEAASSLNYLLLSSFERDTYPDREFHSPLRHSRKPMFLTSIGLISQDMRHLAKIWVARFALRCIFDVISNPSRQ